MITRIYRDTERLPARWRVGGANAHALAPLWRYTEQMPSIQIKNVPDEVRLVYRARAAAAGKSLQEYLLGELIENAGRPTLDEVLDRAEGRAGGRLPASFAVQHLRAERECR